MSPDGKLLALCGRLGEIFLLASSTKELIATLKMNARCRALCFTSDNKNLITHGGKLQFTNSSWFLFNRIFQ